MANRWYGVTVDCVDPERLATFWSALLGRPRSNEMEGEGWATVGSRDDGQPRITFQRVPEPRVGKVRLHLDVLVDDIDAGLAEVERPFIVQPLLQRDAAGVRHDEIRHALPLSHAVDRHHVVGSSRRIR